MIPTSLFESMRTIAELGSHNQASEVVMAEFVTTSTELHNIANGQCCTLNSDMFSIRFLLKDSFKSSRSNFVINKYVIQVLAHSKSDFLRKENIATKTKVVKSKSKTKTKEQPTQIKLEINNKEDDELW